MGVLSERRGRAAVRNTLGAALITCVIIGLVAGIGRAVFIGDFARRIDPIGQRVFAALGRRDPSGIDRAARLREVDDRFARHTAATLLHVVPGAAYMLLVPIQLSRRIRSRHRRVHRWNGRLLLVAGTVSTLAGMFFGLGMPYGGIGEAIVVALTGALFLFAMGRAFVAIRRKQITVHREWMLRALSVALGISVVRIVAGVYDLAFSPAGYSLDVLFVWSMWTGWAIAIGVAEFWIRRTRDQWRRATVEAT